jgi:hypothetical protein
MTEIEGSAFDLGKWTTSAGAELSFSVLELTDGTPILSITGDEELLDLVRVEKDPVGVLATEWAQLGVRLKAADPSLFSALYATLCEASKHPEKALKCPALARARRAA